jgi:hypothetical protein
MNTMPLSHGFDLLRVANVRLQWIILYPILTNLQHNTQPRLVAALL